MDPAHLNLLGSCLRETPSHPHPEMVFLYPRPIKLICNISHLTILLQLSNFVLYIRFLIHLELRFVFRMRARTRLHGCFTHQWLIEKPSEGSHPVPACMCFRLQLFALLRAFNHDCWIVSVFFPMYSYSPVTSPSIYSLMNYVNLLPDVKLVFHSLDKPNLVLMYHILIC